MKWLYIDDNKTEKAAADDVFRRIKEKTGGDRYYRVTIRYGDHCGIPGQVREGVDGLCRIVSETEPDHILLNCSDCASEYAGRLASRLGTECFVNVEEIISEGGKIILGIPVYNGNLMAEKELPPGRTVIAIRASAFGSPKEDDAACHLSCQMDKEDAVELRLEGGRRPILQSTTYFEDKDEKGIEDAERVLVLGHAFRSKDQLGEAVRLADRMNLALGGSRPVIIDGLLPMSRLVGMSGRSLRAKTCLLMGVSGASAFLEGIKHCGRIIAVNTDPDAAIFRASHQGMTGDCHKILSAMNRMMEEGNGSE